MSLVLVKETGLGLSTANSYADVADGTAYHEGHLYATAWTGATAAHQAQALAMATRLIDAYMVFRGCKVSAGQALQWPRMNCLDPDSPAMPFTIRILGGGGGDCFDPTTVPRVVRDATCEMARELLVADRSGAPLGEGLKSSKVGDSAMVFDALGRAPVLSRVAIAMLTKVGVYIGDGRGMVRLERV